MFLWIIVNYLYMFYQQTTSVPNERWEKFKVSGYFHFMQIETKRFCVKKRICWFELAPDFASQHPFLYRSSLKADYIYGLLRPSKACQCRWAATISERKWFCRTRTSTCLECPRGSGGLKKESGSFLILIGTDDGCLDASLGFITLLNRASSSFCESPRTCTTCRPLRCASMSPEVGVEANLQKTKQNKPLKENFSGANRKKVGDSERSKRATYDHICLHFLPHPPPFFPPPFPLIFYVCVRVCFPLTSLK